MKGYELLVHGLEHKQMEVGHTPMLLDGRGNAESYRGTACPSHPINMRRRDVEHHRMGMELGQHSVATQAAYIHTVTFMATHGSRHGASPRISH